jgi:hypothetical protein
MNNYMYYRGDTGSGRGRGIGQDLVAVTLSPTQFETHHLVQERGHTQRLLGSCSGRHQMVEELQRLSVGGGELRRERVVHQPIDFGQVRGSDLQQSHQHFVATVRPGAPTDPRQNNSAFKQSQEKNERIDKQQNVTSCQCE